MKLRHPIEHVLSYESTDVYAAFIRQHVQELLVEAASEPIGWAWLSRNTVSYEPQPWGAARAPHTFGQAFLTPMARRLMLQLLRLRLERHGGDLGPLRVMERELQPVIDDLQTRLAGDALWDFLPKMRKSSTLTGEAAILDALKRYVRFTRTSERGYDQTEKYVLLLHLQLAAEHAGLVPAGPRVFSVGYEALSARLERDAQASPVRVQHWPVKTREPGFRYREIRDPRCRRFRN